MAAKAVFFDLYNTLVYFDPPREDRQSRACQRFGLAVEPERLRRAYVTAENFWTRANAEFPIARRSAEGRQAFYAEYEQILLAAAGIETSRELAYQIYKAYRQETAVLCPFDDVLPTLTLLKAHGIALGVISNADGDIGPICSKLGLARYLDIMISSSQVGVEKPDPRIFEYALYLADVHPEHAVHVGDQYYSDVVGARAAGIRALLLDRFKLLADVQGVERITSLADLPPKLQLDRY